MSKGLSMGLVIVGIIIVVIGVVLHFVLKTEVFPHFNSVVAAVGVVLALVGAWGVFSGRQTA